MTIRVPENRLDEAIAGLKKLADEVQREWSSAEDVTEQYVDLNARLLTLEATEKELRACSQNPASASRTPKRSWRFTAS